MRLSPQAVIGLLLYGAVCLFGFLHGVEAKVVAPMVIISFIAGGLWYGGSRR